MLYLSVYITKKLTPNTSHHFKGLFCMMDGNSTSRVTVPGEVPGRYSRTFRIGVCRDRS